MLAFAWLPTFESAGIDHVVKQYDRIITSVLSYSQWCFLTLIYFTSLVDNNTTCFPPLRAADESGSDEDFMVEDDDDSDYGHSKKRSKKVIRRGRLDKKEKKSPKPRLKATGELVTVQPEVQAALVTAVEYLPTHTETTRKPEKPLRNHNEWYWPNAVQWTILCSS